MGWRLEEYKKLQRHYSMPAKERVIKGAEDALSEYMAQSHNVILLAGDIDEIVQIILRNTHARYLEDTTITRSPLR